jgi:C-terminal processing protease CtpA/Prc
MRRKSWKGRFLAFFLLLCPVLSHAHEPKIPQGEIGIKLKELKEGQPVVIGVIKGGPADLKGVRPGDVITHISRTPTTQIPFEDINKQYLIGDIGSKVELVIRRFGTFAPLEFKINRWQIIKHSPQHPEADHSHSEKSKEKKNHKGEK